MSQEQVPKNLERRVMDSIDIKRWGENRYLPERIIHGIVNIHTLQLKSENGGVKKGERTPYPLATIQFMIDPDFRKEVLKQYQNYRKD